MPRYLKEFVEWITFFCVCIKKVNLECWWVNMESVVLVGLTDFSLVKLELG